MLALVVWALSAAAGAQPVNSAADRLFDTGVKLAELGDCEGAREKFEASFQAEPAPGTLINWGLCDEQLGKLGSAYVRLERARAMLHAGDARLPAVDQRLEALARRVPRLELQLFPKAPEGTRVVLDDASVGRNLLGTAIPLDPGMHVVLLRLPNRQVRRYDVALRPGQRAKLLLEPAMLKAPASASPPQRLPPATHRPGKVGAGFGLQLRGRL
jgi:hypothetical protein